MVSLPSERLPSNVRGRVDLSTPVTETPLVPLLCALVKLCQILEQIIENMYGHNFLLPILAAPVEEMADQ